MGGAGASQQSTAVGVARRLLARRLLSILQGFGQKPVHPGEIGTEYLRRYGERLSEAVQSGSTHFMDVLDSLVADGEVIQTGSRGAERFMPAAIAAGGKASGPRSSRLA